MDHTTETAAHPLPPRRIGRYEITAELGRGAMGVVYKGFDPNVGRTVAIKIVQLAGGDEELIMRFRREAQAAGVLNHPNIVTIYDADEDQGVFYIAMEYVEGETLDQIIRGGPIALDMVKSIIEDVGSALDLAHDKQIIHRDIKPANIMIAGGRAKIMDFGVARLASSTATATGTVIGTPSYMSPEAVKGQTVDGRADIFSLGVVLYEMLTGKRPFAGDSIASVMYKIVGEQPALPTAVNPKLPNGLDVVLAKALAKEPQERYQDCATLSKDLKNSRWLKPPAIAPRAAVVAPPTPAPTPAPRPAPPQTRKPAGLPWIVPAAVLGVIAAGLIGAAVWAKYRLSEERAREEQAAQAEADAAKLAAVLKRPVRPKGSAAPAGTVDVLIKANVDGAIISVDGKTEPSWLTPHKVRMELGDHRVEVSKGGYRTSKKLITLSGTEGALEFRLTPTPQAPN